MQLVLINTERQPRQPLDTLCREIFKVRDHDGLFKSCDECKVDIPDDSPEVRSCVLWACAVPPTWSNLVLCQGGIL
jgi:hypothetical protein